MKKSLLIVLCFCGVNLVGRAQNNSEINNSQTNKSIVSNKPNPNCGCSKTVTLGYYITEYESLNSDSLALIQEKLTFYSSMNLKDIRNTEGYFYQWCLIMRMKDIQWGSEKEKALEFLKTYSESILKGKSFLNKENRNILLDSKGCYFHITDAIFLPQNCYWVMLDIDKPFFNKSMGDIWDTLLVDEPYFNKVRKFLLSYIEQGFKEKSSQILINKLYEKYKAKNTFIDEMNLIQKLRDAK